MDKVINDLLKEIAYLKGELQTLEGTEYAITMGKIIGMQDAVIKLLEAE